MKSISHFDFGLQRRLATGIIDLGQADHQRKPCGSLSGSLGEQKVWCSQTGAENLGENNYLSGDDGRPTAGAIAGAGLKGYSRNSESRIETSLNLDETGVRIGACQ